MNARRSDVDGQLGQNGQTGSVGVPVRLAAGGHAAVVVQVDPAIRFGLSLHRKARNALGRQPVQFHRMRMGVVVHPAIRARSAKRLVVPVHCDVAAVSQADKAVGQEPSTESVYRS